MTPTRVRETVRLSGLHVSGVLLPGVLTSMMWAQPQAASPGPRQVVEHRQVGGDIPGPRPRPHCTQVGADPTGGREHLYPGGPADTGGRLSCWALPLGPRPRHLGHTQG